MRISTSSTAYLQGSRRPASLSSFQIAAKATSSPNENVSIYVPGLHARTLLFYIKWKSKRKVCNGKLVLEQFGRSFRVVDHFMHRFMQQATGSSTPEATVITANAGEYAMNVDLALHLRFATGFAVEPYQLIDLWEQSRRCNQSRSPARNVRILQIDTCNPHIHDTDKGAGHIERM